MSDANELIARLRTKAAEGPHDHDLFCEAANAIAKLRKQVEDQERAGLAQAAVIEYLRNEVEDLTVALQEVRPK